MASSKEQYDETVSPVDPGVASQQDDSASEDQDKTPAPLSMKIIAIVVISLIGFGGHWSSGVTGVLKSTLKKEMDINNTQYALLSSSEAFIKLILIPISGPITDRFGGANNMLWGNAVFSLGAILVAAATQVRNYKFMIFGVVVQSFGDAATQVAQYKLFSSWFPPSAGFASTLGFELGLGKIGTFVGKATANVIAKNLGNFSWVYWMAVFMNIFTNVANLFYWWFTRFCEKRYLTAKDPATGEHLKDKSKRFRFDQMLRLPWTFWLICLLTIFQTTVSSIFSSNGTEMAEQRFKNSAIDAGWYSSLSQFLGFFFVPVVGIFMDIFGHRLTLMFACSVGMLLCMCLAAFAPTVAGIAASFAIYAVATTFGPAPMIDGIRTSMSHHDVFGTAYAIKVTLNNCMTILVSLIAGVVQDRDNDSYDNVTILYVVLAACAVLVSLAMVILGLFSTTMGILQWGRKKRSENGHVVKEKAERFSTNEWNRKLNIVNFSAVLLLMAGASAAYFWGIATGRTY
ncbi:unnamed protein product [Clonostachys solani]|uniref:Lysosomal dipeptide transporter MFSD1 n=1 Tax=Clonostachys solani TaxID=160281 RepID=A0A9N9W444_9HYPO|nr:unnamed protein product [Clonostachys solani]